MELDITIHKGKMHRPVVIFIHGLGMDKNIWANPLNTKIFARNIPLKIFAATQPKPCSSQSKKRISIGEVPDKLETLWTTLKDKGFNIICWSQRRPTGPISVAVEDLEEVMGRVKRLFPKKPIALLCHSRGGLIARKFMERKRPGIKTLITLSTPNAGSTISLIGKYLSPLTPILRDILPRETHGAISETIRNITNLLEGNTLKELLPGSDFFKDLKDFPVNGVKYTSFGGTEPKLFTVYTWKKKNKKMYPRPLLSIPDSLLKLLPSSIIPDEMMPGKGDILVSAKSSLLPWASNHYNFPVNHISIMWHDETINNTLGVLKKI